MICLRRIALAVALLGSAPGLAAADGGASRPGTVAGADTNGDGVVTLSEARAAALRLFERFDRDADGVVTRAEASSPRPRPTRARSDARFAELDRDGDGRLSRWESRLPPRRFARLDRDADARSRRPSSGNPYGARVANRPTRRGRCCGDAISTATGA